MMVASRSADLEKTDVPKDIMRPVNGSCRMLLGKTGKKRFDTRGSKGTVKAKDNGIGRAGSFLAPRDPQRLFTIP